MKTFKLFPSLAALLFLATISILVPVTTAQGHGDHGGPIDGVWKSNIGAAYEIMQHGGKFLWWSERLNETAMGVVQGNRMRATWNGSNGAGTGEAKITRFDDQGRARRIEWSNGVVFTR
jgi:hypothetical protein